MEGNPQIQVRAMTLALELRSKGQTFEVICRALNDSTLPAPRARFWNLEDVMELLERSNIERRRPSPREVVYMPSSQVFRRPGR